MRGENYLCFDMECPFTSTGKRTLYVYMSGKTWMQKHLRNMFPSSSKPRSQNILPSSLQENDTTGKFTDPYGIQIGVASQQGFSLFGHVHKHTTVSDCLANFFFQDWVSYVTTIITAYP